MKNSVKQFLSGNRKSLLIIVPALLILSALLYMGTADYAFLKDDFRLIVENPRIKDIEAFSESIGSKFFSFPDFPYLHYWRPLSLFTFYADYQLWGLAPKGYHLFNIVLNSLNVLLVFLLFYFISGKIVYGLFISLFFAIHPSHVEAVTWISGRTDLLSAFFVLSALLFFILYLKTKRKLYYGLTLLCFIPGLLSKENAVFFPLLALFTLLLSNYATDTSHEPKAIIKKPILYGLRITLPFWLLVIIYIILHNQFSGVQSILAEFSFNDIFVIGKTIGAYTRIIFIPFFPTPYFSMQAFDGHHILYLGYFILAASLLWFIYCRRDHYRYTIFSLVFLVFLLPVIDPEMVPSYPQVVIRFAYIPSIIPGVFFLETYRMLKKTHAKLFAVGILTLFAVIWSFETISFQRYYEDDRSHYSRLLEQFPDDGSLLLPMALIHASDGDRQKSLTQVSHALDMNYNDHWKDLSEMGGLLKANLLILTGKADQGKAMAQDILNRTQKDEMKYFAYIVLSKYHEKTGNFLASLGMLKMAQRVGETPDLMYRLALAHGRIAQFKEALSFLEEAKKLNPELKRYRQFKQYLTNLLNQQQRQN